MASKEEIYAEAYRRGILPADKKAIYEEAVKRGLMSNPDLKAKLSGIDLPDIPMPPENKPKQRKESATESGLKETARAMITGAANLADVVPEMGDAVVSAAAWLGGVTGLTDGTYNPAMRFKEVLPEAVKPKTTAGKIVAEMIPYMVSPESKAADIPRLAENMTKAGSAIMRRLAITPESLAKSASQNLVGSLAQADSSNEDFAGVLADNMAMGEVLHQVGRGLGFGYRAITGAPDEAKKEVLKMAIEKDVNPETLKSSEEILSDIGKAAKKGEGGEELAYAVNPSEDVLNAADRLGMENTLLPSHYSTNPAYQSIEQGLKSIPGSVLNTQEKKTIQLLAGKADDLISEYGGTIDKTELSDRFKKNSLDAIRALEDKSNDLFKEVEKEIPKDQLVGTKNIMDHLREKADIFGGQEFLSAPEQNVMRQMDEKSMPTYARLNAVRQQIGDALSKKQGPFKDVSSGELKQLYGKLAEDQQQTANFHGVGNQYRVANDLVSKRKGLEKDLVSLLGKDLSGALTTKAGQGLKGLSTGNYKLFDQVMGHLPSSAREELVLTALNDAFTSGSRLEKQMHIPGFVDWYEGIARNPGALARVEKNLPTEAAKRLRDIYTVAKGIRTAKSKEITTGRIQALLDKFDKDGGVLSKIFGPMAKVTSSAAAGATGGAPAAAVASTAIGLLSKAKDKRSILSDQLLASSEFKSLIRQIAAGKGEAPAERSRLQALISRSDVYKKWHDVLSGKEQQAIVRQGLINWLTSTDEQE